MRTLSTILLLVLAISLPACQRPPSEVPVSATATVIAAVAPSTPISRMTMTSMDIAATDAVPRPSTQQTVTTPVSFTPQDLAAAEAQVGYIILTLPITATGYRLDQITVDAAAQRVCLHYMSLDLQIQTDLYLVQEPLTPSLQLRAYPGIQSVTETVTIGGADKSGLLWSDVLLPKSACADNNESPRYILTWEFRERQFLLYASGDIPAGGPGLTQLDMLELAESLTGVTTHPANELDPDNLRSITDAENLAGFDVKEPTYLSAGVSFLYATYEETPRPSLTLYFKIIHQQYGDRGRFFLIRQERQTEAYPSALTCGEPTQPGCELLQIGTTLVVYHQYSETESLNWYIDGFSLLLLRIAGEPNKTYKDELVRVVEGLK